MTNLFAQTCKTGAMAVSAEDDQRLRDALHAAKLYYQQDLTMEAIGRELRVSRSSVSRLLALARNSGIVDIRITSPSDEPRRIESQIRSRYGVRGYLVPVPDRVSPIERLERVAMSAARMLGEFFSSNMTMGVAWGQTIGAISRHLVRKPTTNSEVVQLNGAGNDHTTGVTYSSEILSRFGVAYNARVEHFPVPAFFDNPQTKKLLWAERSTQRVRDLRRRMDIALFGLGSMRSEVPGQVYTAGYLSSAEMSSLAADGVVGDVATVFFRSDGSWSDIALNQRSSGPDLDQLRLTPRRLCVVSGPSRLDALRGALAAELITDLIVDTRTARALIDD